MSEIVIQVKNLSKVYKIYNKPMDRLKETLSIRRKTLHRDHHALREVTFDVHKGETLGIIGTNGSGKSTLLKIITGVLNQTSGSVEVKGKIAALLELGAGFNPEYTGMENIYLNGTMMGYTREEIDKRVSFIRDFADIGDFIYQPVKTYSSGMFVRLAFAVAINVDPEILIVDEALSVGDVFFQLKCYKRFDELKKSGKTILFVTHSLDTIIKYCDRAILLDRGNIILDDLPKRVIDEYKKKLTTGSQEGDLAQAMEIVDSIKVSDHLMKESMVVNPSLVDYGSKKAEIVDYGIFDQKGCPSMTLIRGEMFGVKMVVRFNESIKDPIFAITFKDLKGNEIAGTNSLFLSRDTGDCHKGEIRVITFTQKNIFQNGALFLSLGCTGYDLDSQLTVYHRLYDLVNIQVISEKNIVGYFDMDSEIEIVRIT